jgi:hypothetical protein
VADKLPAVGTRFTLPDDPVPSVRGVVFVVTSTAPGLVRYRAENDPRVGKRPITEGAVSWRRNAREVSRG